MSAGSEARELKVPLTKYEKLVKKHPKLQIRRSAMLTTNTSTILNFLKKFERENEPKTRVCRPNTRLNPAHEDSSSQSSPIKPGTQACFQERLKKRRGNPSKSVHESNSPIKTYDTVDETFIAFLPEMCQRFNLKSKHLDPIDLCVNINLRIPDLNADGFLFEE